MIKKIALVISLSMGCGFSVSAQDPIISEFTPDGRRSALEIFNPSLDSLELGSYSIRNSNNGGPFPTDPASSRYYTLDGMVLPPLGTLVFANSETPTDVKALANVVLTDNVSVTGDYILHFFSDDAIGLFRNDTLYDIIGKEAVRQVWDVAGVSDVTDHTSNGAKTMIRKPTIEAGNSDWDESRGYLLSTGFTDPDSAEWIIVDKTYALLGQHDFEVSNSARLIAFYNEEVLKSGVSGVTFGTFTVGMESVQPFVVENKGDIDLVVDSIFSSDDHFILSTDTMRVGPSETDTLWVTFSPSDELQYASEIVIYSNSLVDDIFTINCFAGGTSLAPGDTLHYYVSPQGDDGHAGTSPDMPLRSIAAAIQKITALERPPQPQLPQVPEPTVNPILGAPDNYREIIHEHLSELVYPVMVHLMPGYYFLDEPVTIDLSVGGNIHFVGDWSESAIPQVKSLVDAHAMDPLWLELPVKDLPVVSGGRIIQGWEQGTVNGVPAWVADLPEVASGEWYFKQLFVNGRRATRSRYPKDGFFRITQILPASTGAIDGKTDRVRVREGDVKQWKNLSDVEMVHFHRWVDERMPIESFDEANQIVKLSYILAFDMNGSHPIHGAGLSAYYCEHVFETMNQAGEWYLDRSEGKLYYIPRPGETPENTEVIAPKLINLFSIAGSANTNHYLWNISFSKLAFMHTRSQLGDHFGTGNGGNYGEPAILFENARVPVVKACYFGHLCEPGVGFGDGTMGGEIAANVFRDLGSGGTYISSGTTSYDQTRRTGYHHNHDNDILGYGRFYQGEVAMRHSNNVHLVVEHNYIRDGYYNGITLGCSKTVIASYGYKNTIRKNHIHTIGQGWLSDMGGIYPSGYQPGSLIENNLVHDINCRDYTGAALYMDDNISHFTVRGNLFYNSNLDLVNMKGHSVLFENNILAFGSMDLLYKHTGNFDLSEDALNLGVRPSEIVRNIFIQNGGQRMFRDVESNDNVQFQIAADSNIYWNYSIPVQMNDKQSFAQWKAASGDDGHSILMDPLMKDPLNYNFALAETSPADSLGFQEIDLGDVGPRKSVWEAYGAVWIDYPDPPERQDFLPSEVPGLHFWITAKDLENDKVVQWEDRSPNRYSLYQADYPIQPELAPGSLNGFPVVRFDGTTWMGSEHKSLEVGGLFGKFDREDFTIFSVHRSTGDQQVVIAKGENAIAGNWSLGELQNRFSWSTDEYLGVDGEEFELRCYRRKGGKFDFLVNGITDTSSTSNTVVDFFRDRVHFSLGRRGQTTSALLNGDIAEILMYMGEVSEDNMQKIWEYLRNEWGFKEPNTVRDLHRHSAVVYPNPVKEQLIVEYQGKGESFQIMELSGKILQKKMIRDPGNISLDVSGMDAGFYFINITTCEGGSIVLKWIKQ